MKSTFLFTVEPNDETMSRVNKRKHVLKEMLSDNFEHPTDKQQIVRVINSRGNNLHEVESADDTQENYLVSMPTKYRNNIWIKRGDFVIVESIEEGNKVKAEIVRMLTQEHIKEFTKDGVWPEKFSTKKSDSGRDCEDDLFINTNRPVTLTNDCDSSDEESSDEHLTDDNLLDNSK